MKTPFDTSFKLVLPDAMRILDAPFVPRAYAYLGTGNPALPNTLSPGHNGNLDIDEDTLVLGARLYADYAVSGPTGM